MDKVIDCLYISDIICANDRKLLKQHGITHIVSCYPVISMYSKITYHNINIDDEVSCDIYSHFYNVIDFIDIALSNNGRVLVHCYAGVSRSATIILAYLMAIKKYRLVDAIELLQSKRNICNPNPGFLLQLECFEWALSLCPIEFIKNNKEKITNGIEFRGINFDFSTYEILFTEDLETCYDGCIFIDKYYLPKFRPLKITHIDAKYPDTVYQIDLLKYVNELKLTNICEDTVNPDEKKQIKHMPHILVVSTDLSMLVVAYWNLIYRSGMQYRDGLKHFNKHATRKLKNTYIAVAHIILYPYNTPTLKIIEKQLKQLDIYEKHIYNYKSNKELKRYKKRYNVYINAVEHYFIPEILEKISQLNNLLESIEC